MKLMKKFMKKSEGFTLVELIVVIAILAILAGVAVPAYSAYIKNANDSAAESELVNVLTGAKAAAAMQGKDITLIEVTVDGVAKAYTTDASGNYVEVSFTEFYSANATYLGKLISDHSEFGAKDQLGAQWTSASGKWAAYATSAITAADNDTTT